LWCESAAGEIVEMTGGGLAEQLDITLRGRGDPAGGHIAAQSAQARAVDQKRRPDQREQSQQPDNREPHRGRREATDQSVAGEERYGRDDDQRQPVGQAAVEGRQAHGAGGIGARRRE
jgi:hypothetical protein